MRSVMEEDTPAVERDPADITAMVVAPEEAIRAMLAGTLGVITGAAGRPLVMVTHADTTVGVDIREVTTAMDIQGAGITAMDTQANITTVMLLGIIPVGTVGVTHIIPLVIGWAGTIQSTIGLIPITTLTRIPGSGDC